MIVTLHQINATIGDFKGNLSRILVGVREAEGRGSSLALFPELALTGYPPLDLLESGDFIQKAAEALENLREESRTLSPAIIVGTVLPREHGKGGKPNSNAAVLIRDGRILGIHRKILLPTYDVFDETRYFHPGDGLTEFEVEGCRFALSICEDIWNDKAYWSGRQYQVDPVEDFFKHNSIPLINISASPFSKGKNRLRREMVSSTAKKHGIPVLYVNLVGGNDSLVFDGASIVMNREGHIAAQAGEPADRGEGFGPEGAAPDLLDLIDESLVPVEIHTGARVGGRARLLALLPLARGAHGPWIGEAESTCQSALAALWTGVVRFPAAREVFRRAIGSVEDPAGLSPSATLRRAAPDRCGTERRRRMELIP